MGHPVIRLNWCATCCPNFGDTLGPILLRHYGLRVEWAKPADAEVIGVGSILSKVPSGWTGTVWGTGFIAAGMTKDLSRARVLAVRGRATARACGLPDSTPLGDPGILVGDLPRESTPPIRRLVIPHQVDHDMAARHRGATVLGARDPAPVILGAIAAAEVVISSSLHILIAADALGVPHVLEPHPRVRGGLFKYRDYASAFGERFRPNVERLTPRPAMAARQAELRALVECLR